MDKLRRENTKLRNVFILYVSATFSVVVILSGLVIWGCMAVRGWLLPASDKVYLNIENINEVDGSTATESYLFTIGEDARSLPHLEAEYDGGRVELQRGDRYSVTSLETSFSDLSPKRRFLYHVCGIGMIVFPAFFSMAGILACGLLFYNKRLKRPIAVLSEAAGKIAGQDLDFEIASPTADELGRLCTSFEQMRQALVENNRRMWGMLEERKRLQASVAHDLRNPIAIIESHAEYLQVNLPAGRLANEKIVSIAGNIKKAAERLEVYTESIRTVNHLEELEVERKPTDFSRLFGEMEEDFIHMADQRGIQLSLESSVGDKTLCIDPQVLYRILENLVGNAVRYAKSEIKLSFSCPETRLEVSVADDGPGFSEKMLRAGDKFLFSDHRDSEHSGIGLTICRILCRKHGGELAVGNGEAGGACVRFFMAV